MPKEIVIKEEISPFALLTSADTAKMDQAAGEMLETLMENAGRVCADVFCRHVSSEKTVLIAAGPGNNGGDGYVMARYLAARGYQVAVAPWRSPKTDLAKKAAQRWQGKIVHFSSEEAAKYAWVVDGVFGAGFNPERDLPDEISDFMVSAKNRMAIDMPSGISSDSGALAGKIPAYQRTIAFTAKRPGHLLAPGRKKCGTVEVCQIGLPPESFRAMEIKFFHNHPGLFHLPLQIFDNQYSKYIRGVVSIVGGRRMPGAACLSADAARRSGAGIVRLTVSEEMLLPLVLVNPGLIADTDPLEELLKDSRRKVWVCGPGLSPSEAGKAFEILSKSEVKIIADAGLLGWASGDPLRLRKASILTPHEGEFTKLFGTEGDFSLKKGNRLAAVQAAAKLIGTVVLLKGSETIIAHPDGHTAINLHSTPALATAGSGDVLSGILGTCLAAGMDIWEGACAGAWLHGEAGIRAAEKEGGWPIAEDVVKELGHARQRAESLQK
ncbi:NAD(P)H-hydrate dehydratase [Acetobacteraceae bacterium]|nr:NAD(P)H-hydrate dehydratase [Acetobacteraceae bacterium]